MNVIAHPYLSRFLRVVLIGALLLPAFTRVSDSARVQAQSSAAGEKVLVPATDQAALDWLNRSGALRLAEYEAFSLWQMPERGPNLSQSASPVDWQIVDDAIYLRDQTLLPAQMVRQPERATNQTPEWPLNTSAGFWMVQFIGPLQDGWLAALRAAGLETAAYLPNFAYVVWGQQPDQRLAQLAAQAGFIQWIGPYQPQYRLSPDLEAAALDGVNGNDLWADVTVQVYPHSGADQTIANLATLADSVLQPAVTVAGWSNISLRLPLNRLSELAAWPDVFNIEPWYAPEMLDEAQGQLLAGNVTRVDGKVVPTGPGYLEWLNARGFPTDPNRYPIVDVVDDGIDSGNANAILHPDFYQYGRMPGSDRVVYLNNCTGDASANGVNGHGNLNAGIMAGFNNRTGFPYEDSFGYQYGLGISPYGRIAGTKVFQNDLNFSMQNCGGYYNGVIAASAAAGAAITSNSWGSSSSLSLSRYTAASQIYDSLTRDASDVLKGGQPMLHIFSAGNGGMGYSITPPATAKNVLTVGASENTRDPLSADGCGHSDSDNADDIAPFSSRGPLYDGRMKPDLVAPGLHVQGPASQAPGYTGKTVCGNENGYYPSGQTLYTWSSGTSHSAPAVAGAAQLAYEYYGRVLQPGSTPSPAMLKALLINATRYLTGTSANDTLPSPNQGWGSANLGTLFDGSPHYVLDQSHIFTASGNELSIIGGVVNPNRPVRVTLVWTDAPGATTGAAYVNDLDLEVSVGGKTYRGNVFYGGLSTPGGSFDFANNIENVFLPAGQEGAFQVRVIARNIAGDGLPGNSDSTDQDFALVIDNGQTDLAPELSLQSLAWSDSGGQIPRAIEPGENVDLTIRLANQGNLLASGITSSLTVRSGQATILNGQSAYPNIAAGAAADSSVPLRLKVSAAQPCGEAILLTQVVQYYPLRLISQEAALPTGFLWGKSYTAGGLPTAINDWPGSAAVASLAVDSTFYLLDVNVTTSIQHARVGDLALRLLPPAGSPLMFLSNRNGGTGANYDRTTFDDQASQSISDGSAPFPGSFRPQDPLSVLIGKPSQGTWQLQASDQRLTNSGQITQFTLNLRYATCDVNSYNSLKRLYLPLTLR